MAKRFIPLKFIDYDQNGNENEITLMFRFGPIAYNEFVDLSGGIDPNDEEEVKKLGLKGLVYQLFVGCKGMKHDLTLDKMWKLVDNYEFDELEEKIYRKITPEEKGETDPNDQK